MLDKRNFSLTNKNSNESTDNQIQEKLYKRIKTSNHTDIK